MLLPAQVVIVIVISRDKQYLTLKDILQFAQCLISLEEHFFLVMLILVIITVGYITSDQTIIILKFTCDYFFTKLLEHLFVEMIIRNNDDAK